MRRISPIALSIALSLLLCSCAPSGESGGQGSSGPVFQSIDEGIDYESIVLQKADSLGKMIAGYYSSGIILPPFALGRPQQVGEVESAQKVYSLEFRNYAEFKALFNEDIYDGYIDYINSSADSRFFENEGRLYYIDNSSGGNTACTWYLGYDVEKDRIVGHFAELKDDGSGDISTSEYLNNKGNYEFYDIVIQKMEAKYLVTDCVNAEGEQRYMAHGYYNISVIYQTLVTNPELMPEG